MAQKLDEEELLTFKEMLLANSHTMHIHTLVPNQTCIDLELELALHSFSLGPHIYMKWDNRHSEHNTLIRTDKAELCLRNTHSRVPLPYSHFLRFRSPLSFQCSISESIVDVSQYRYHLPSKLPAQVSFRAS